MVKSGYQYILPASFIFFCSLFSFSQTEKTEQQIFMPSFGTLEVQNKANFLAPPVININSNDRLVISFDELTHEFRPLKYRLVHCSALWEPTNLIDSEFIDGFNETKISDYSYSRATLSDYIHYSLEIPGELRPLLPGNYLLIVEEDNYPYTPVLQVRFSINENSLYIEGKADARTDIDYLKEHQQLSIFIEDNQQQVDNLYTDLILTIEQNSRPETLRVINSPTIVTGRKAHYEHLNDLIYAAGDEYRRFEISDLKYPGIGVDGITMTDDGYLAILNTDTPKAEESYVFDETQNGKYVIREYYSDNSDTEAEYINVMFTLKMPRLKTGEIYIEGDLTGRKLDENSRMTYDYDTESYTKNLVLKQGAYNYQYIVKPYNSSRQYQNTIDGNKYQTNNEYIVKAYYRKPGERYDRLGGVGIIRFE